MKSSEREQRQQMTTRTTTINTRIAWNAIFWELQKSKAIETKDNVEYYKTAITINSYGMYSSYYYELHSIK